MDKKNITIFLSLFFWVQITVIVILGAKLLFFNQPVEMEKKTLTPAEVRGEKL